MLRISDPASMIASIPPLIGFRPVNSAVLVCMKGTVVACGARVDLPSPELTAETAAQLAIVVEGHQFDSVILIVFGGGATTGDLPYCSLVTELKTRLSAAGVDGFVAFWAAEAAAGAPWGCYCGESACTLAGALPDPDETALAAHNVANGLMTAASRDELHACVRPAEEDTLTRRTTLIEHEERTWRHSPNAAFALVSAAVDDMADGKHDLDDLAIARLSLALQDTRVRDAALSFATSANAAAAENVFFALTRESPAPYRAEAAALGAFYAYLAGRGAHASLALGTAFQACPDHRLAGLLHIAINAALPLKTLNGMALRAVHESLSLLDEQD
ncbi:hypothetical protein ADL03_15560 [Nocardia sp. NRRL S-836]|nr:hypothetical protein ADL03_15560 [Nocardia sp. NRRL S-836]